MSSPQDELRNPLPRPHRVVIIGAGRVGATFAYTLLFSGLVGEIVLIDVDRERAKGEVMDLNHAMSLARPVRIWAGDYEDYAGADVVVITAGVSQRPGDTPTRPLCRRSSPRLPPTTTTASS